MVSVNYALANVEDDAAALDMAASGLDAAARGKLQAAYEFAREHYGERLLGSDEPVLTHGLAMAVILTGQGLDLDTRLAALLFDIPTDLPGYREILAEKFGATVAMLVHGIERLAPLRVLTRAGSEVKAQTEVLRKMLLAMVEDIRVVLLRVASRTQTLRWLHGHTRAGPAESTSPAKASTSTRPSPTGWASGSSSGNWRISPSAFWSPAPTSASPACSTSAGSSASSSSSMRWRRLKREVQAIGVEAEVYGRPKHIYSIYNKMRAKRLDFSQIYDVRALRVLVDEVKDCYAVLGIVHQIWTPIPKEFDDYISMPKGNNYQSLHTAVYAGRWPGPGGADPHPRDAQPRRAWRGRALALQGRAAGPRAATTTRRSPCLRSLLSWRDEVTDSADWLEQFKRASLDDTIYVLTPQGRVIDLPRGATPIDFAYRVHTDSATAAAAPRSMVNLVTLNTPLESGQTVEIMSTKEGGPSRDWLNAQPGLRGHAACAAARSSSMVHLAGGGRAAGPGSRLRA
jgi:GTP pyrophosphokinase